MYDTVIIGAGPAGISAGIYTARAKLKTLTIGKFSESKMAMGHKVQNYFGFSKVMDSKELLKEGTKQAKGLGAEILEEEVVDVKKAKQAFEIKDSKNKIYETKTIIIATGSKIETINVKNEKELTNRGIHYCALCDGPMYNNKTIAVIGDGNHAAEEALILSTYSKDLTIVSHNKKFNISNELMEEISKRKIRMVQSEVLEFTGKNKLESIKTKEKEIKCDAAFMAVGTASSASFARKLGLELTGNSIKTDEKGETSMEAVYAAGEATGQNK
ncbi:MAG: FAD-dependent oxidoreductase, partial [archaeon]